MLSRYLLFLTLLVVAAPITATAQQAEGIVPGAFSIKLTEGAVDALDISQAGAFVTTGVASLDELNARFGVTGMTRIFRPAGRFEARHRAFGLHRWYSLVIPDEVGVRDAVRAFQADPAIEIAEPVYEKDYNDGYEPGSEVTPLESLGDWSTPGGTRAVADTTNDPFYDLQWHYHNTGQSPADGTLDADIDLPEAHNIQTGDASVIVSIHDQGIQTDHEDLAANMWVNEGEVPGNDIDDDDNGFVDDVYGYNFADDQGTINPGDHGTHVAGTVAAVNNNETGVAGVAGGDGAPGSGVRVMSAQIFSGGSGGHAESFVYAADMGAVISQNSWGYINPGVFEQAVLDAIDYYIESSGSEAGAPLEGGLVIFAAGNDNSSSNYYPGYYAPTVAVASTNIDDHRSSFSNFGTWVDISAPGGTFEGQVYGPKDVASTVVNGYGYIAGTSMACPHASGVAALIVSENLGSLTSAHLRAVLEFATDDIDAINPGYAGLLGTGRINAATAVEAAADTTAPGLITNLAGVPDGDFLTLTWTAPADEDTSTVQNYHVRYALEPIEDETDWESATVVEAAESIAPQEPGETEELVVTGLDFETTYYFIIRSWDGLNLSGFSNAEDVTTLAAPVATVPLDPVQVAVPPEIEETVNYTISNAGPSTLSYSVDFNDTTEGLQRTPVPKPDPSDRQDAPSREGVEDVSPAGEPQRMDEGGPDAFGYRWIDSNELHGPTYDWIDITETGTEVELGTDDHVVVDLPFDFSYYENTFNWVAIQSKGALTFADTTLDFVNKQIPAEDDWNGMLAGYWDDLNPDSTTGGGAVYYDTLGDGRFVVSWVDVPHYLETGSFTFQIILEPGGGIVYQYQAIDGGGTHDNSATVGIENRDGTDGLQIVYNAPYVEDGLAVRFIRWLGNNSFSGQVASGEALTFPLLFSSVGLDGGTYTADMIVTTNEVGDNLSQEYTVPITMTVEGIGTDDDDLSFEGTHRLSAVAPNPVNGLARTTLEVAEAQDVQIELFDVRGRKVATAFEGALAARTAQEITLDAGNLAPGVYVLRISGETFSETRRITVVR